MLPYTLFSKELDEMNVRQAKRAAKQNHPIVDGTEIARPAWTPRKQMNLTSYGLLTVKVR